MLNKAQAWIDANLNALLVGNHGVGKTTVIKDLCTRNNLKLKYYSCATLDPYTDLVGIPVPVTMDDGQQFTKMIRPRDIDEAEIVFFDELNRADPKVLNAVLEIIQFHSINGEHLPKLRMCWAAINPNNGEYQVEELDPALIDRFDVFEVIEGEVDVKYLVSVGIREDVAIVLKNWWSQHDKAHRASQITPRRIEKIGHVYQATGDFRSAIPKWFDVETDKLRVMLSNLATTHPTPTTSTPITAPVLNANQQTVPNSGKYTNKYIGKNLRSVIRDLKYSPSNITLHNEVANGLASSRGKSLIKYYATLLDYLMPQVLEGLLVRLHSRAFAAMYAEYKKTNYSYLMNLTRVVNAEAARRQML